MILVGTGQGFDAVVENVSREAARISIEHPAGRDFQGKAVLELGNRTLHASVLRPQHDDRESVILVFETPLTDSDLQSIIPATESTLAPSRLAVLSVTQRVFLPRPATIRTSDRASQEPPGLRVSVFPFGETRLQVSPEEIAARWLGKPEAGTISAAEYEGIRNIALMARKAEKRPWEVDLLASQAPEIATRWSPSFGKRPRLIDDALLLLLTPAAQQATDTLFSVLGPSSNLAAHGMNESQARLAIAATLAARKHDPAAVDFLREVEASEIPIVLSPMDGIMLPELTNAVIHAVLIGETVFRQTAEWVQTHPYWGAIGLYLVVKVRERTVDVFIDRTFNRIGELIKPKSQPAEGPQKSRENPSSPNS